MDQEAKVGTPSAEPVTKSTTAEVIEPGVIYPRCPHCPPADAREDGTRPGDPLRMWRLRYDFPDGVVAEVLFCQDCRAFISATIVGFTPAAKR